MQAPSRMEPMLLPKFAPELADLASQVAIRAQEIGGRLHPDTLASLSTLVRIMNCYYSNLIEGHPTRPRDIERALESGGTEATSSVPNDPKRDRLLKLSFAHIETQIWIDKLYAEGKLPNPAESDFIKEVHRRFYRSLPKEFLEIRRNDSTVARVMVPGEMRKIREEVKVGDHNPPLGGEDVKNFMNRYEQVYGKLRNMGPAQRVSGIAAAHHRLLFIHPFDDGNGRVARLITYAMFLDAGLGAQGLWSMSRGFARGLRFKSDNDLKILKDYTNIYPPNQYKAFMSVADQVRRNDYDGRGNLSQKSLEEFVEWFLSIALDQINFMESQFRLKDIVKNISTLYISRRGLDARHGKVLSELVRLGELPRGSVKSILGISARLASNIVKELIDDGIATSKGPKGGIRLNFNLQSAEILFPSLFGVEALLGTGDGVVVSQ